MNKGLKKTLGLIVSLFLVLGIGTDALALQAMLPHITKSEEQDISTSVEHEISNAMESEIRLLQTQTLRNVSPSESVQALKDNLELYYEAKEIEKEVAKELESKTAPRRKIQKRQVSEKTMDERVAKIAERRQMIKIDKRLAKEARYAQEDYKYIFNPRRFMLGPLGERIGLGHAYLGQERPGLERFYRESDGFRLVRLFDWINGIDSIDLIGVAGRVELVEEPFPLESLILDAKKLEIIKTADYRTKGVTKGMHWERRDQFRTQILPIFTKSTAIETYLTYGNLPKFSFTYDYREIYHQYESLYGFKDWDIKTFEFRLEDTRKWYPIGYVTLIPGFKYQIYDSEDAYSGASSSANEHRDWYFLEFLWGPSGTLEFYGKVDAYKTSFQDLTYKYSPWHWGVRGEIRKKFLPWRLNVTGGYASSFDKYSPFENFFRKQELYLDVGKDFTGRLKGSSRWEWIYAELTEDDNQAPTYTTFNPYEADAKVLNSKNKIQYEVFKNIFLTGGFDHAASFNFYDFNNFGLYTELEYYNAGYFRCNLGYRYTRYYYLEDELNTVYFKLFLFM